MIKVDVTEKHGEITDICIYGHAFYDDFGQDIVCAGVSVCSFGALNAFDTLCKDEIDLKVSNDAIQIHTIKNDDKVQMLLEFFLIQLQMVYEQYPKNIQINRKEV